MHKISGTPYQPPLDTGLDVRYEDEHCLIVNKPAGLLSVPGKGVDKTDCMSARVLRDFPNASVMHRLDMNTSGLMLFALTRLARQHIQQLFERRALDKTYFALVDGIPEPRNGAIIAPMRCDWPNRPRQMIDFVQGKEAITHYSVVQPAIEKDFTLIELQPKTGRSHQLRVHLASIGVPILGDQLYGNERCRTNPLLHLHASKLSFLHPESKETLSISCPPIWF